MTRQFIIYMAFAMSSTIALIAFGRWTHARPTKHHANWQLCRLDMLQPLDSGEVRSAQQLLKNNQT